MLCIIYEGRGLYSFCGHPQLAFPHRFQDLNLGSIGDDATGIIHALSLSNSRLLTETLNSNPIHLYGCGSLVSLLGSTKSGYSG